MITKRFFYFILVGGVSAGVNWGSCFIFLRFFDFSISVVFSYFVGMVMAFILMRGIVFKAQKKAIFPQVWKFILINAFALVQTLFISLALASYILPWTGVTSHPQALAHLVGVLAPVVSSYFGHKFLTFR